MALKLAVVVHGRFHAFDLVRALLRQQVEVTLVTNYPKGIAARFEIPTARVVAHPLHGLVARCLNRSCSIAARQSLERILHPWFSRWACRVLATLSLDAIYSFSGVSTEILQHLPNRRPLCSVVRGSVHIRTQARLLREERLRCGQQILQPSRWMINRETREYALADFVIVLSTFAARSFVEEGFPAHRLRVLPLGVDLKRFRADEETLRSRRQRILSGAPMVVLTAGSFSYQKGALDYARVAERLQGRFLFRWVGDCPSETKALMRRLRGVVEFVHRQEQFALPREYRKADLFLFPTIQDGFGVVLEQAAASGLPILATTNSAAPDLIARGVKGWVVPIRDPQAITTQLLWCDVHREQLADMVSDASSTLPERDWGQVASELAGLYARHHTNLAPHV